MEGTQIPRLELPSGQGWVEFIDLDDLTGADVHQLRAVIRREDGGGETTNALFVEALRIGVKTWQVDYLADPRTPEANPAAWKKLKARDLQAVEMALEPILELLRPAKGASIDDTTPGSPTPPASE